MTSFWGQVFQTEYWITVDVYGHPEQLLSVLFLIVLFAPNNPLCNVHRHAPTMLYFIYPKQRGQRVLELMLEISLFLGVILYSPFLTFSFLLYKQEFQEIDRLPPTIIYQCIQHLGGKSEIPALLFWALNLIQLVNIKCVFKRWYTVFFLQKTWQCSHTAASILLGNYPPAHLPLYTKWSPWWSKPTMLTTYFSSNIIINISLLKKVRVFAIDLMHMMSYE